MLLPSWGPVLELDEVKGLIDTYHAAGKTREETVTIVTAIPTNGIEVDALEYADLKYATAPGQDLAEYHLTDAGNAEYFRDKYGDSVRYDHRRNIFLQWKSHRWKYESDGHIMRLALRAVRDKYKNAVYITDIEARTKVSNYAIQSEQRGKLESALAIARNLRPIADSGENWDADPMLFCVLNGVIELRTGDLRIGKPEDRITQQSPVIFDDSAKAERWLQFMGEIFDGDTELIEWWQRYLGYCLTGDTREQVVPICYGMGANGKTIFTRVLRLVAGDYAYDAPFSTFELSQRAAIPNDVAALVAKRVVTSSETNEGSRFNEARIKALSGQDSITARFLHGEFFTFNPVAKFILAVNHRPRVQDDSYGFWRRVRLIPFNRQFMGDSEDKQLLDKLTSESSGILNWMIDGCLKWQQQGLDPTPACIQRATEEYKTESDPLSQFILDECVLSPQARAKATDLYKSYSKWCDDQGMKDRERLTVTAFGRKMGQKFKKPHNRAGTIYLGIGSKCDGFVTGFEPESQKYELFSSPIPHMENKLENSSQPITTLTNPSHDILFPETCPNCGAETWKSWKLDPDDPTIYGCKCGYRQKEGE